MNKLPPTLRERVLAQAQAESTETRPKYAARTSVYLALGVASSLGLFAALGGMNAGDRAPAYLVFVVACAVSLCLGLGVAGLRRTSAAAIPTSRLVWSAVGLPLGWALVTLASLIVWPCGGGDGHAPRYDITCGILSMMLGLGPLVSLLFARRGTVFVAARWSGAAMGALCFTAGALLVTLVCPCALPMHMALGHVVPAALAGAVLGAIGGTLLLSFQPR